jgi:uncharacterized membrane protein
VGGILATLVSSALFGIWHVLPSLRLNRVSPIVWWSPRLMLSRPDWLREPRGADVSADIRRYPLVTFWQVTADMALSTGVPAGHGHSYGAEPVAAWADIAPRTVGPRSGPRS